MTDPSVILGDYIDFPAEIALACYLVVVCLRRRGNGLLGITGYMITSVGIGGLRMYASFLYGPFSPQYALWYWLTDYALVFAVFLLIVSLFRRACAKRPAAWRHVRLMLASAFVLTGVVSCAYVVSQGHGFFPYFVIEFQQDLYFACSILTTLLYLMIVKFEREDDQLGLLVTGLGMMFAGFAASVALFIVAGRSALSGMLTGYITPLSEIAMVSTWFYVAAWMPKRARARHERQGSREALPARALARTALRS